MRTLFLSVIGLLLFAGQATADDIYTVEESFPAKSEPGRFETWESVVPRSSWFIGAGGSFNIDRFDQDMFAAGVDAKVYQAGTLVAFGGAGGFAKPREDNQSSFAPAAQLGYFSHFDESNWLWGAKLQYHYPNTTANTRGLDPQFGLLETANGPDKFTGHVVIGSYKTQLNHEIAFMPFIGRSFDRFYVYMGAGPTLFGTKTNVDNVIGFADVNGMRGEPTGAPLSFASSQWAWGATAQVGLAYYLTRNWFLDVNYSYARSAKFGSNYSSPFTGSTLGYDTTGTLIVAPSQRVIDQAFTVTINLGF